MVLGLVAILAVHLFCTAHVDVDFRGRVAHGGVQVPVFDMVAAAAIEMAGAAGRAGRFPDRLGHFHEISGRPGLALWGIPLFPLHRPGGPRRSGTSCRFRSYHGRPGSPRSPPWEVELGVFIAVSGMAAGAAGPVAGQPDAEVVQRVVLADVQLSCRLDHLRLGPGPVDGLHEVLGFLLMTLDALLGDFGARLERTIAHKIRMIGKCH